MLETGFAVATIATLVFGYLLYRLERSQKAIRERFAGVLNVDDEIAATTRRLEEVQTKQKSIEDESAQKRLKLTKDYEDALTRYDSLKKEISLLEESENDISFGLYKPHFAFQHSEDYKVELDKLRVKQRDLIRSGGAVICPNDWRVNDSKQQGQRMIKQYSKLLVRAFNAECDAAVANVVEQHSQNGGKSA